MSRERFTALASLDRKIYNIISADIYQEFIELVSKAITWAYSDLYHSIAENLGIPDGLKAESFANGRSGVVVLAMVRSAKKLGIPYYFRKLDCNGQYKLFLKIGRILLTQEPILTLVDRPRTADYKVDLAAASAVIRQLELNLGDRPHLEHNWDGGVFGVLLHGSVGKRFGECEKELGALMFAVPNAAYSEWDIRLDLHRVALFGFSSIVGLEDEYPIARSEPQMDRVTVRLRKKDVWANADK